MSHWMRWAEGDRAAAIRTLGQRDVRKRAKIERLDLAREQATNDDDALRRDAVISLSATARIDEESAEHDVETDKHKWNSPELEEERGLSDENRRLPEYGEATPQKAKGDEERILPAEANAATRLTTPQHTLA